MRLILTIEGGPGEGRQVVVSPERPFYVGRTETAYLAIPEDGQLATAHFVLECTKQVWYVRDLGTRAGTFVNGEKITKAALADGGRITAGRSTFVVRLQEGAEQTSPPAATPAVPVAPVAASAPVPAPPPVKPAGRPVLEVLREQKGLLYAILDVARDPMIYVKLQECGEENQSLYEGEKGQRLALAAPYLVRLPLESPFLPSLVKEGWGKSWGVYLTSARSFTEVRKHLRHFLLVQTPEGKQMYFRFYDPRVLRIYLPTCTAEEAREFFGPVFAYSLEGKNPEELLCFTAAAPQPTVRAVVV
jgi:pSer/pThr/pTyr-binding forkhead associated (FHA) protein